MTQRFLLDSFHLHNFRYLVYVQIDFSTKSNLIFTLLLIHTNVCILNVQCLSETNSLRIRYSVLQFYTTYVNWYTCRPVNSLPLYQPYLNHLLCYQPHPDHHLHSLSSCHWRKWPVAGRRVFALTAMKSLHVGINVHQNSSCSLLTTTITMIQVQSTMSHWNFLFHQTPPHLKLACMLSQDILLLKHCVYA